MSIAAMLLLALGGAQASSPAVTVEDYARAERFVFDNPARYVLNGVIPYAWIAGSERLYYLRRTHAGKEFILVDATTASRSPAFDHSKLAESLAAASGAPVDARDLPFSWFDFVDGERAVEFDSKGKRWRCLLGGECKPVERRGRPGEVVSPDGKWAIYRKDHNVWLRPLDGSAERQLTSDGTSDFGYGGRDGVPQMMGREQPRTVALWSPDSRRVLIEKIDVRGVLDMYFLQTVPDDGSVRPKLYPKPVAMPGEPHYEHVDTLAIFDVTTGRRADARHDSFLRGIGSLIEDGTARWSADSRQLLVMPNEVFRKTQRLLAIDGGTGQVGQLLEESSDTYIDGGATAGNLFGNGGPPLLSSGEFIWYSERSDWGHLYLYDDRGQLKNPITRGEWKAREVIRVDERRRQVYFTANGREPNEDPYQRHLYVTNLDGSGLRLLTPENADHHVEYGKSFSRSGRYFVETYSRPDRVPVTALRDRHGKVILTLETADISRLEAEGFAMPEPFSVLAADGKTKLYGTIFRPARLDPTRRYPVIDSIYPGPHVIWTKKSFLEPPPRYSEQGFIQGLAELGFVVLTIDGRGTPLRSKSFHDVSYGNMQQAGNLEDHIVGIKQLAQRYPYMDLERVGIVGHSAGGFATVRALLDHPDFYKVGVSSAGDHDQRGDDVGYATTYQGPPVGKHWEPLINGRFADRLQGKLLLIQGDMDEAVHPAVTLQLVDALIKANKDFELLIVPNAGHKSLLSHPYVIRRRWDFFVRHLLGAEPPAGYQLSAPAVLQ